MTVLTYYFRALCFHTDFCTARPAWSDVGLALNLLLLITDNREKLYSRLLSYW